MPAHAKDSAVSAAIVRQQFIDFFKERAGHTFHPSSPVVPHDDPSLLFANAGMNQFKPCFLGAVPPGSPLEGLRRAVNSQKCIRAGGKHNDLDDVGKDSYHHTFFEMLGNWSFGDYFKAEAIQWAWELLTKIWNVDESRLYATYFEGDESLGLEPDLEARDLWLQYLPQERVLPGDTKDNFWEMGDAGPCGPCSEVHYDSRPDHEADAAPGRDLVNQDHDQVIEIWNLVFIQFNRSEAGLAPLPAKHVDTGMGLERITRVLQHKTSNYDTDVFTPIFDAIQRVTGAAPYTASFESQPDTAYRVIADHIRTLCFAIADGAEPSNEGRGYVLRRILRRAVRYGRQTLNVDKPFFAELVPTVVHHMSAAFPELAHKQDHITAVIKDEEASFARTLDHGIELFEKAAATAQDKTIPANDAFKLYDTHGFPVDLTQLMAEERGMTVDTEGFHRLMQEAKERSRAGKGSADDPVQNALLGTDQIAHLHSAGVRATDDARKFSSPMASATVRAIWDGAAFAEHTVAHNQSHERLVTVVTDRTNFYAEMGGQVADTGLMRVTKEAAAGVGVGKGGEFRVESTRRCGDYVAHVGRAPPGASRIGATVALRPDKNRRGKVTANHTATHLLNFALRQVLGHDADQRGSLVADDRLRFDFAHGSPLSADEAARVEAIVVEHIDRDQPVHADEVPLAKARGIKGLRAVFGEAYPDPVRVVSVGVPVQDLVADPENADWARTSVELCGGVHAGSTGVLAGFAVVSEENVSKGVRRIVAVTGDAAVAAHAEADRMRARVEGAADLSDKHLPAEVSELGGLIDGGEIPIAAKAELRGRLTALQDRVKRAQKEASKAGREKALEDLKGFVESIGGDGAVDRVVARLEVPGGDRQVLMAAMDSVTKRFPGAPVLLVGVDEGEGKVLIAAKCPEGAVGSGLKAGDWVRVAAQACGGKGGGRPDSAQGGGTEVARVADAIAAAEALAAEKLG